MTFYEIYESVVMKLWGDSTPPTSATSFLQGDEGLISKYYRKVQQDYNYWFMRAYTYWDTVVGTQTYNLPDNCKEIISMQFKVNGEDYFKDPLSPLQLTDPFTEKWPENNNTAEYPEYYEMIGESITLYPSPNAVRTLHLIYWTLLTSPVAADWVEATSTENAVTQYAGEQIAYFAASDYSGMMKEYDQAQYYNQKAQELIFDLKQEDFRRRQAPVAEVRYGEF